METKLAEIRDYEQLSASIELAKDIITKDYLYKLEDYEVSEIPAELKSLDIAEYTRLYRFKKFVSDKKENTIDKLVTVFNAAYSSHATVVTLIKGYGSYTDYYLGVVSKDIEQNAVSTQGAVFNGALTGNFPGVELESLSCNAIKALCDRVFECNHITSISGITSLRNEEEKDFEKFVQGIEHLVDSLQGRDYSVIVIADPVNANDISLVKSGYEQLYTQLSPFLETSLSFNESDTITVTQSHTESVTKTFGESTSFTQNSSKTSGWNRVASYGTNRNRDIGGVVGTGVGVATAVLAGSIALPAAAAMMTLGGAAGIGKILGSGLIGSFGENSNESTAENESETRGTSETFTQNRSNAEQSGDTHSNAEGTTQGRTVQFKNENKKVRNLLDRIDNQLERLEKCEAYGAFNSAAYVISSDPETNAIVANGYNALMT